MQFDFEHTLDHRRDHSIRWQQPPGRDDVLGMGTADLDFFCPPCMREALEAVARENTFNYRSKPEEYARSVLGFFRRRYGLAAKPEWLSNVPGTLASIRLLLQRFTTPGDHVLMQTPYFSPLRDCIEGAGCRFLENPMLLEKGRYELDFADFEAKIREFRPAVFLLVNPPNPTGRVFTREKLERMVSICAENHVLILSDEVHFLITFDEKKHIPILSVSEQARKISFQVFSLSKGFNIMSLPHAMILISDPRLREQWLSFLKPFNFHYASNSFSIAAVTAVTGGGADRWLEECTACLQQNRDLFLRLAREKALPITPLPPEAGYLLWIDCRQSGILPEELDRVLLEEAGLGVNNGLGHGEAGRGFIRLNFGVTESNLRLAVERLEALFRRRTEKQKR